MSAAPSERALRLFDESHACLLALAHGGAAPTGGLAADAARRLEWSGSWLDVPYRPRDGRASFVLDLPSAERRLRELTDAFEELVESFEEDDPVRNANGVQAGSLAFAVVSDAASRLARLGRAR